VPRDNQRDHQREGQPYQPREQQHQSREYNNNRDHRPPQYQPQPQPQPVPVADGDSVDRLPSFITGPQPQINGGAFEPNGHPSGERFQPRRRRRPHGPRPDGIAAPATPGDDFNPGNE
jgi:hypothetical protein